MVIKPPTHSKTQSTNTVYTKPNRSPDPRRRRIQLLATDGGAKQSFKDECDINTILERYMRTGALPDLIKQNPRYGDFANVTDYQTSMNLVLHANDQFANLPAAVRDKFNNDPVQFLEFTNDPNNMQQMVEMGLATPKQRSNDETESPTPTPNPNDAKKGSKKTPASKPSEDSSDE